MVKPQLTIISAVFLSSISLAVASCGWGQSREQHLDVSNHVALELNVGDMFKFTNAVYFTETDSRL